MVTQPPGESRAGGHGSEVAGEQRLPWLFSPWTVAVVHVAFLVAALAGAVLLYLWEPEASKLAASLRLALLCGVSGCAGGTIRLQRNVYKHLITRFSPQDKQRPAFLQWNKGWWFFHLVRPLAAGVIATVTIALVRVGALALWQADSQEFREPALLAVAWLAGFACGDVLDVLEHLSKRVFRLAPQAAQAPPPAGGDDNDEAKGGTDLHGR